MKRKVLSFTLIFLLLFTSLTYAVNISIDGENVGFTEQTGAPFVDGSSRTQVPLRVTMESFGATVKWNDATKIAIVEKDGIEVEIPIGKAYIIKNGQQIKNDTAALIKDGKTYLPIRAVLEAFGATVGWDNATQTVTASKNKLVSKDLEIHFIDVGQADCILIELPTNEEILIDTGNKADTDTIINYLKSENINDIEYLILTHPHEDHIGSAANILNTFKINKVYMPDTTTTTQVFKDTVNAIINSGATTIKAKAGEIIINNADLKFEILAPNSLYYSELNEYSVVTKLTYKNNTFLFTGDAESVSELEMVNADYNLNVDLLKVGHHGGETSTSQAFLNKVTPTYAVISVGKDNDYGHPNQKTLDRLVAIGAKIYRTDEQGTIIAKSNGSNITIDKSASTVITPTAENKPVITTPTTSTVPTTNSTATVNDIKVKAGENATVSIKGTPNTNYQINVYYSSGLSKAKGLEPKPSDANGNVSWTWKVGSSTKAGDYKIEITGDKTTELKLVVE